MDDVLDTVVQALSNRDIEAFIRCYAQGARIEDADGVRLAQGHDEIRDRYSTMFRDFPHLTVRRFSRVSAGVYVAQEEEVTGRGPDPERHLAVYRVIDNLIAEERLLH